MSKSMINMSKCMIHDHISIKRNTRSICRNAWSIRKPEHVLNNVPQYEKAKRRDERWEKEWEGRECRYKKWGGDENEEWMLSYWVWKPKGTLHPIKNKCMSYFSSPFLELRPFLMVIHLFCFSSLMSHSDVPRFHSSHLAYFVSTFSISPFLRTRMFPKHTESTHWKFANYYIKKFM